MPNNRKRCTLVTPRQAVYGRLGQGFVTDFVTYGRFSSSVEVNGAGADSRVVPSAPAGVRQVVALTIFTTAPGSVNAKPSRDTMRISAS